MTLVQASIAENGNAIILISDRLLTRYISGDIPPYEFESNTPKIVGLDTIALGFAGSELHASNITSLIKEEDNREFSKIVELVSEYMVKTRSEEIEKEIKRRTGIGDAKNFLLIQIYLYRLKLEKVYMQ